MRKGRFLKYLLAMAMAVSTAGSAVAQETVRFTFNSASNNYQGRVLEGDGINKASVYPKEASAYPEGFSFYRGSLFGLMGPGKYVPAKTTGRIVFEDFRYEVSQITWDRHTYEGLQGERNLKAQAFSLDKTNKYENTSYVDAWQPNMREVLGSGTLIGLSEIVMDMTRGTYDMYLNNVIISYYKPVIRVRFANGNKGYDVSIGETNCNIEAYISEHPGAFVIGENGVQFEYTSSNTAIAEIDASGHITPRAEGNTTITATLIQMKNGERCDIASYEYPLHVFVQGEGLTWSRYDAKFMNSTSNSNSYTLGWNGNNHVEGIDWNVNDMLKSQTTIWENESRTQSEGQYKQIAGFTAPVPNTNSWRFAVQKLSCEIMVPKYTRVSSTLKFGANVSLGSESKSDVIYGYELVDLGVKTDAQNPDWSATQQADERIRNIVWDTESSDEKKSSVGSYRTDGTNGITYLRNGAHEYRKHNILTIFNNGEGYVGDHYSAGQFWSYDNSTSADPYNEKRYFAVMTFLQNQFNYSATASFGYQDIPTYEYFAKITYNPNGGNITSGSATQDLYATGHNGSSPLVAPTVTNGSKTFLGWSTKPEATTVDYRNGDAFNPYDNVNGGGMGNVTLYAVWQEIRLDLDRQGGVGGDEMVIATKGKTLPAIQVPTKTGYTFEGYYESQNGSGTQYYDASGKGKLTASQTNAFNFTQKTLYAKWTAKSLNVTLNRQGGSYGTTSVNATFGADMPTRNVSAPSRSGYTFKGYYESQNGEGKQYYTASMTSANKWDKEVATTLYAYWVANTYTVTLDHNGGDGSNETVTAIYGQAMPDVDTNGKELEIPTRKGYVFDGYFTAKLGGTKYYNKDLSSANNWNNTNNVTLYAHWTDKVYTIVYHSNDSRNLIDNTQTFERDYYYTRVKSSANFTSNAGKNFLGWSYTPTGGKISETYLRWDNEHIDEYNAELHLYAIWEGGSSFIVTLDPNGGTGGTTSVSATVGQAMPTATAPTREGYKFDGYYLRKVTDGTLSEVQYYNAQMNSVKNWDVSSNAVLFAHWQANIYKVSLVNTGFGISSVAVDATFGEPMPNKTNSDYGNEDIKAPSKKGYNFDGYYLHEGNSSTGEPVKKYYNADLTSVNNWDIAQNYVPLYPHFVPKKIRINFDPQGGNNGTSSVDATYDQSMPYITAPQRQGYTFAGYYDQPNGQGKKYYDFRWGNVESVTSWDKDVVEATLYAYWAEKDYTVEFVYPKGGNKQVTGYKTNSSNNTSLAGKGITSPTPPEGSVFAGWAENDGKGSVVYDADGNAVEGNCWQRNSNGDIVWIGGIDEIVRVYPYYIKDMVTVNVTVVRDDNYEKTDYNHRYVGVSVSGMADITSFTGDFSGYITVDGENFLSYLKPGQENYPPVSGKSYPDNLTSVPLSSAPIWHFELREGATDMYNIYTVVNGQKLYLGPKVESTVTEDAISVNHFVPEFPFIIYGGGYVCYNPLVTKVFNHVLYMKDDTNWEYENTGRNPQYKPIKIIVAGSTTTTYGNLNAKTVIKAIKEKLTSPEYAYNVGKTNVQNADADLCKGLLYVDMSGAAKVMETTAGELKDFKDKASANCLFFMPKTYNNTLGTNVVTNMGDKYVSADDLVITDKVPFSSPYTFSTGSHIASYNRVTSDKWGSMCLPFPVKRSGSDMKFYNLYGSDDIRLAFQSDDGTNDIPANEPIACYGSGSFTLTSNSNAVVPADNASREYDKAVTAISCDNIRELVEDKKQMTKDSKTWNFKGVRFDSYVYGTEYTGTLPNRAKKSLVYYFSKDKFTYVNSKGRVKFAPFRAYLQAPEGSSAKTFSLLVFDEDGATDITEIIDGNAGVANGKIYDLFGRRVKTPLKGHIYIVDGKKKQY